MKSVFFTVATLCLMVAFAGSTALADPFLTCDPQAGIDKYRVVIPSKGIDEESAALPTGAARHDIGSWPVGSYSGEVFAGSEYKLNGVPQGVWLWSPPAPLTEFVKPNPGSASNMGIVE